MKNGYLFLALMLGVSGCSTLEQSLRLGGGMGALAGVAAIYAGTEAGAGRPPSFEAVAISAGVGSLLGLATAYYSHKSVEADRQACQTDQIEMDFGDLPPSPFIVPKPQIKKGVSR